jgi:tmRNA-binding protein
MRIIMARPTPTQFDKKKTVAENRRARFDYFIEDKLEAGIALTGTEVKSLRFGEGSIAEAYAGCAMVRSGWLTPMCPNSAMAIGSTTNPSARANCCSTSARSRTDRRG